MSNKEKIDVFKKNTMDGYPFVYIHGLFGWGAQEGIDKVVPYWGATSCHLMKELNDLGYESYAVSIGSMSSNWDRVCELYAALTGTRVDYGVAHSKSHNHARYGRDYEKPLVEGWGEMDKDGKIKKLNLVGHSFGGVTARTLAYLLEFGSKAEQEATDPDDISPLFTGGKKGLINSIVTICAPHDGTTLAYFFEHTHTVKFCETLCFGYAGIMGRTALNGFVDFHLEQFDLSAVPKKYKHPKTSFKDSFKNVMAIKDKAMDDLYPDGAKAINDEIGILDDVYYFSYAYDTSRKSYFGDFYVPKAATNPGLRIFSRSMGHFKENDVTDYPVDSTWLPNDGMVSVVSALHPSDEPYQAYNPSDVKKGIWNVMPVRHGDHGTAIGLFKSKEYTVDFYIGINNMVNALGKN